MCQSEITVYLSVVICECACFFYDYLCVCFYCQRNSIKNQLELRVCAAQSENLKRKINQFSSLHGNLLILQ